ncbi:MAG: FAD-dependent oxidoreductase [Sulfitobacter sp.]|nr:FAD-dependent oxidoreductase [Sulfitobacter sp.]
MDGAALQATYRNSSCERPAMRIVIIGAGVAGLSCARALSAAGRQVTVLDKGRGLGGRMATRRTAEGFHFDHGAQYISARSDDFHTLLSEGAKKGFIAEWPLGKDHPRYVGTPGMTGLAKFLVEGLDVRRQQAVTTLEQTDRGWVLDCADQSFEADIVVSTAPAPQTAALLGQGHPLTAEIGLATYDPCLTLMIALHAPLPEVPRILEEPDAPLAFIARNETKPQRPPTPAFTAHASPDWSLEHMELEKGEIANRMADLFCDRFGISHDRIAYRAGHRWRYAQVSKPLGRDFVVDNSGTLYAGGDWCLGPRIEAAWTSGKAIAEDILEQV